MVNLTTLEAGSIVKNSVEAYQNEGSRLEQILRGGLVYGSQQESSRCTRKCDVSTLHDLIAAPDYTAGVKVQGDFQILSHVLFNFKHQATQA